MFAFPPASILKEYSINATLQSPGLIREQRWHLIDDEKEKIMKLSELETLR
jgi:hypothetical protein